MDHFALTTENIPLPKAATPRARRIQVRWHDRNILDLTQGLFRSYLFPVYSPQGVALTAESPVDHPHHNSITIGADVFFVKLPPLTPAMSALEEEATYNLYVNQIFQGRAPGRTWAVATDAEEKAEDHLRIVQQVQWQGPEEWGAADGRRVLAAETRTIDIYPGAVANVIDIRSQLRPTEWDITIGPTRHAYFTIRLADGLRVDDGGTSLDSEGRRGAAAITGQTAAWVDMSGPCAHGHKAGISVIPHPSIERLRWNVADWGTITVNPFMDRKGVLNQGATLDLGIRVLAHDGDAADADVAAFYAAFKCQGPRP